MLPLRLVSVPGRLKTGTKLTPPLFSFFDFNSQRSAITIFNYDYAGAPCSSRNPLVDPKLLTILEEDDNILVSPFNLSATAFNILLLLDNNVNCSFNKS
jgi:hypothetical protein